jgi:hypothetical protein
MKKYEKKKTSPDIKTKEFSGGGAGDTSFNLDRRKDDSIKPLRMSSM